MSEPIISAPLSIPELQKNYPEPKHINIQDLGELKEEYAKLNEKKFSEAEATFEQLYEELNKLLAETETFPEDKK